MSNQPISKKLIGIISFLSPGASLGQINTASSQLSLLVEQVKTLEDENLKLNARIQELESS
jgi:hypothetical protein